MKAKKGFTLVEMIVVIAIIGILLAILVPTWSYFIMRANVRSQNNYSKVLFNSAQTTVTRCKFQERDTIGTIKTYEEKIEENKYLLKVNETNHNLTTEEVETLKAEMNENEAAIAIQKISLFLNSANEDNEFVFDEFCLYWDKHKAYKLKTDNTIDTNVNDDALQTFAQAINKVFSHADETCYKIYIKDYKVESVCSAASDNTESIGSYPVQQEGRSDNATVQTYDMKKINLSTADD